MGDTWNGWTIKEKIGEGSYGKVYRIVRDEFGHIFESALKVIRVPQNQSEVKSIMSEGMTQQDATDYYKGMVRDLVDEIALMDDLKNNINIVRYEDHMLVPIENEFGWNIYIRMELLTPLVDHMGTERIRTSDVIKLGIDICSALEECHSYHIIHRDIKPENVFYSEKQNCYKLGDFGIARRFEKTSGMSKKGTYSYMAPEVYKGLPYNETVDEYSLGILLYQLTNNNRLPFMPDYPEKIHFEDKENASYKRLSGEQMKPPCNADDKLSEIILRACSFDPKERYASIAAMKSDLSALLETADMETIVSETEPEKLNSSDAKSEPELDRKQNDVIPEDTTLVNNQEGTVLMFDNDLKRTEPIDRKKDKSIETKKLNNKKTERQVQQPNKPQHADPATHYNGKNNYKEKAKDELRHYKKPEYYSGGQRLKLIVSIERGCNAIDDAAGVYAVTAVLKEFKWVIDSIKTDDQLKNELQLAKSDAICMLDEQHRNDVSDEEKSIIQLAIRDINNAETVDEIEKIKEDALTDLQGKSTVIRKCIAFMKDLWL